MSLVTTENTHVKSMDAWGNFHATLGPMPIPMYCTTLSSEMRKHGRSIIEILQYCFQNGEPLRPIGARWSLSAIGQPKNVAIDIANMDHVNQISHDWLTADYVARRPNHAAMIVQCGATIASLNRRFGLQGLAMQTSGASDGHRIAGCIATGTHGANVKVGAVHDTVLGLHVVVSPDKAFFIQPSVPFCRRDVASWLGAQIGIPTDPIEDDEVFRAALVSLGAIGFVHAVVVEAAPVYMLRRKVVHTKTSSGAAWKFLKERKMDGLADPIHVQTIFNPYLDLFDAHDDAFLIGMDAIAAPPGPVPPTSTARAVVNSDVMSLVGGLLGALDSGFEISIVRPFIRGQMELLYPEAEIERYPGSMFGPTTLAPGPAASTEVFVNADDVQQAIEIIRDTLRFAALRDSKILAGGLGVRIMAGTKALLGMNMWPLTAGIEIPSIRTPYVQEIYWRIYNALSARLRYVCHWGQQHQMTPQFVQSMYGQRADAWRKARERLLDTTGRKVFATPYVEALGLA